MVQTGNNYWFYEMNNQSNVTYSVNSETLQEENLERMASKCRNGTFGDTGWCPEVWDEILCWPSSHPGKMAEQSCPFYIAGFDPTQNATRYCMPNGQWYWNKDLNNTWTNYTQCYNQDMVTVVVDLMDKTRLNYTYSAYVPLIKAMANVGYTLSLSSLLVAFCVLAVFKKLKCARNFLHMHLFVSFMIRASMAILKDQLLIDGVSLAEDITTRNGNQYWIGNEKIESTWTCKLFTGCWQYSLLANYFWILMEGLYLHNLIFRALFADANSGLALYVSLGWGVPAIFISLWAIARALFENTICWTINENFLIHLIIDIPTSLSVVVNFVLFISIVKVLLVKLKSSVSEETKRYKRFARSTLVLVPLFGVHYVVFLVMSYVIDGNQYLEVIWLACDQFFASFQGFFIAFLYCFLNGEVKVELAREFRTGKWRHYLPFLRRYQERPRRPKKFSWWRPQTWSWNYWLAHDHEPHRHSSHSMASTQVVGGTRRGSLESSKGYQEIAGTMAKINGPDIPIDAIIVNETNGIRDHHRWSDSECSQLTYELRNLHGFE